MAKARKTAAKKERAASTAKTFKRISKPTDPATASEKRAEQSRLLIAERQTVRIALENHRNAGLSENDSSRGLSRRLTVIESQLQELQ